MENQEMQTPLTGQWNDFSKRVQQLSVESARALESAEQARSEATHARFDAEACTAKLHSHRRSLAGLWSVVAVVALALGGVTWYGYRTAQRHDNWFAKLPAWEQTLQGIGDRITATETKLETWAGDWKGVGDRLGKLEKRVTANTPPCFIWHTAEDEKVPVQNCLIFAEALKNNAVPFELHVFPHGRHGLGLAKDDPIVGQWKALCANWLKGLGF